MSASKTTESDVACVLLTKYPTNNIKTFKTQYENRALAKYGSTGGILKANKEKEFPPPGVPKTVKNATGQKKTKQLARLAAYKIKVKEILEEEKLYKEQKLKLFGDLKSHISKGSLDDIMLSADYAEADVNNDPLKLWRIVLDTHNLGSGLVSEQKHSLLTDHLNGLNQEELGLSLPEYIAEFRRSYEAVTEADIPVSVSNIIWRFFNSLEQETFGQYVTDLYDDNKGKEIPTTLERAFQVASAHAAKHIGRQNARLDRKRRRPTSNNKNQSELNATSTSDNKLVANLNNDSNNNKNKNRKRNRRGNNHHNNNNNNNNNNNSNNNNNNRINSNNNNGARGGNNRHNNNNSKCQNQRNINNNNNNYNNNGNKTFKCSLCDMDNHSTADCGKVKQLIAQQKASMNNNGSSANSNRNNSSSKPTYYTVHSLPDIKPIFMISIKRAYNSRRAPLGGAKCGPPHRLETILDSGASISLFSSDEELTNLREGEPIVIHGVSNKRVMCSTIGTHPIFGDVYFLPRACAVNILSLSKARERFYVEMDRHENCFHLTPHHDDTVHHLFECYDDLYVYRTKGVSQSLVAAAVGKAFARCSLDNIEVGARQPHKGEVVRVQDLVLHAAACEPASTIVYPALRTPGGKHYTAEQVQRATECQWFHQRCGHPGKNAMLETLKNNVFSDNHLTVRDYANMEDIFGPCQACIKGKMTAPEAVTKSRPEPAAIGTVVHADIVFVFAEPYLLTEEDASHHLAIVKLKNKSKDDLTSEFDAVLSYYRSHGHEVKEFRTDHERNLASTRTSLGHKGVVLTQAPAGNHSRKLERQMRVLRERMRVLLGALPYILPYKLYRYMAEFVVTSLNNLANTATGGRSPREIITGKKPSLRHSCRCTFGELLLCHVPNAKDKLLPTAELCIFLNHEQTSRGEVLVYAVERNKVVTRAKFVPATITDTIIKALNSISSDSPPPVVDREEGKLCDEEVAVSDDCVEERNALNRRTTGTDTAASSAADVQGSQPSTADHADQSTHSSQSSLSAGSEVFTQLAPPDHIYSRVRFASPDRHKGESDSSTPGGSSPVMEPEPPPPPDARPTDTPMSAVERSVPTLPDARPTDTLMSAAERSVPSLPDARPPGDTLSSAVERTAAESSRRYPKRDITPNSKYINLLHHIVLNMSIKQARNKFGDIADQVVIEELQQLVDKHVFHPVDFRSLSRDERQLIISCLVFIKEKCKPNGDFDKLKARLVAGGHQQDKSLYPNRSSPTVDLSAFLTVACIAVKEKRFIATADIAGAFLNSELEPGMPKNFLRIDRNIAQMLLTVYPECEQFINPVDGTLIVELDKSLYGLIEAPYLWFKNISATLTRFGFKQCVKDPCVFNLETADGHKCTVCIHVDDLFITATQLGLIDQLLAELRRVYEKVNSYIGDSPQYLGMELFFNRSNGTLTIKQRGYVADLLQQYNVQHTASTPCELTLMEPTSDPTPVPVYDYTSKVMKLMFLAKRSRPDILLTMAYLATKCKSPTGGDMGKLDRVLRYINGTRDIGLTLKPDSLVIHSYIDASYASHADAKSHSGAIISIGMQCSPVFTTSTKQKLVSRSSTEAELIALHEGLAKVAWLRDLMHELNYDNGPAVIFQDNKSTITLAHQGFSSSGKSKHIAVRYFYVKQLIEDGDIVVEHLPTDDMIADILTKPMVGKKFYALRDKLLNLSDQHC